MSDFSTQYLGLKLNGPIVVSSTPISESIDNVRRMEDSGASAIVLHSLFEEQLALESKALDDDLKGRLTAAIKDYKGNFLADRKAKKEAAGKEVAAAK